MQIQIGLFLSIPLLSIGQSPTITQQHLPQAGNVLMRYVNPGGPQFAATPASADPQYWNYAASFNGWTLHPLEYIAPDGLAGSWLFPEASLASLIEYPGYSEVAYYSNGPVGFRPEGIYTTMSGETQLVTFHDHVEIPVPFTYGTTFSTPSLTVTIGETGMFPSMTRRWTPRTVSGDAFGIITTPAYPEGVEVVRLRTETGVAVDSLFIDTTMTGNGPWLFVEESFVPINYVHYHFLRSAQPPYVMFVAENGDLATYYGPVSTTILSDSEPQRSLIIYRDADVIGIKPPSNTTQVRIIGIDGKNIYSLPCKKGERLDILTYNLAAGTYLVNCLSHEGISTGHEKFTLHQ
jgi:hypothetical protein